MSDATRPLTLSIDIGGSGTKLLILDADGEPITERARKPTPQPATPQAVLEVIDRLAAAQGEFDRISVGFPGIVRDGTTWTAHNLDDTWIGFPLGETLSSRYRVPVRVLNDADMQGFAVIEGRGVELVLTLGTGFGSALFVDGRLVPNLELAHHAYRKGSTYEDLLGDAARREAGRKRWSRQVERALHQLARLFSYDVVYLGGGNAKRADIATSDRVRVVSNIAGLLGGMACWRGGNERRGATRPSAEAGVDASAQ